MNHSYPEVYFFVAVMRLACAMLLNKQRRKLLWFLHNYPLKTALQVIFQRTVGNGVQSPIKANGSKSIQGRQQVPAKVLCWFAKGESAATDMHPVPLRAHPGCAAALLPCRKCLLESLKLANVGTAPVEKGNLLYCLLSWWHFAYYCWFGLEIWLFQGLTFRNAFQCAHCIPAPAGNCIRCSAPVHLRSYRQSSEASNMHADFYMLMDLLPASVFLQPAALVALEHISDLYSQTLFLEVIYFKACVITGRNPSLQRVFKTALFLVSYLSAFFSCLCLRKNFALDSFYNWHANS